ncbi:hypothetical protein CPT03_07170 [Pedobacter ginsengisoli]|uniref:Thioredoxin domain-containing protein n=1 Tax=Pedobacter ginsengisoli TaxID=363852 RepID=A0A2D1U3T6_9SPHI|nr:thioredoxin family protein [Pedobacter ginsengisoli]ATP56266.1 hypothetical protein CPT03_07170 [Pedobacter ginsengisoli]
MKILTKTLLITVLTFNTLTPVRAQGLKFENGLSWEQVKQKAKAENKPIFLDVMATWCGSCKYMDANVYSNDTVQQYFKDKFISVKVQTDQTSGDDANVKAWYDDARKISTQYKVTGLPSLIFLDTDGNLLYKHAGGKDVQGLIATAQFAQQRENQYWPLLQAYLGGKKDPEFLKKFGDMARNMGYSLLADKIIGKDYFSRIGGVKAFVPSKEFSGNWHINYQESDFGKFPLRLMPKSIKIVQSGNVFQIERFTESETSETFSIAENLKTDGHQVDTHIREDRIKRSVLINEPDKGEILQYAEFTLPGSKFELDFESYEHLGLSKDGKVLTIEKKVNVGGGQGYSVKGVYVKD